MCQIVTTVILLCLVVQGIAQNQVFGSDPIDGKQSYCTYYVDFSIWSKSCSDWFISARSLPFILCLSIHYVVASNVKFILFKCSNNMQNLDLLVAQTDVKDD